MPVPTTPNSPPNRAAPYRLLILDPSGSWHGKLERGLGGNLLPQWAVVRDLGGARQVLASLSGTAWLILTPAELPDGDPQSLPDLAREAMVADFQVVIATDTAGLAGERGARVTLAPFDPGPLGAAIKRGQERLCWQGGPACSRGGPRWGSPPVAGAGPWPHRRLLSQRARYFPANRGAIRQSGSRFPRFSRKTTRGGGDGQG